MHPAQRQAIYAMLQSVQGTVMAIQQLLNVPDGETAPASKKKEEEARETLTDEEEQQLEEEIERDRLKILKMEAERVRAGWDAMREENNAAVGGTL